MPGPVHCTDAALSCARFEAVTISDDPTDQWIGHGSGARPGHLHGAGGAQIHILRSATAWDDPLVAPSAEAA
jgi:hypothetical protein